MTNDLKLQNKIIELGLDYFIIPNNDEFMSEYLPESEKRLEFVTGFSGSNGIAIIGKDKSAFFTDGRYTLQATNQVDSGFFEMFNLSEKTPIKWLLESINKSDKIGFDPKLHSINEIKNFEKSNIKLTPLKNNPIDQIWQNRPASPNSTIFDHDLKYCGVSREEKIKLIISDFENDTDYLLLTCPASICWLLNIRGSDVDYTPFILCYALVSKDGKVDLFIDDSRIDEELKKDLNANKINIKKSVILSLESLLGSLGERSHTPTRDCSNNISNNIKDSSLKGSERNSKLKITVHIDPNSCNQFIYSLISKYQIIQKTNPCLERKAIKNKVEINGMIQAHKIDGLALTKFLNWIEKVEKIDEIDEIDEIKASDKLLKFRQENKYFIYDSFATISSYGSNGAIIHYHPTSKTNKKFKTHSLYLVDSGGQYPFGTTDVTRTIAIGTPTEEMIRNFTLVLKGHIAVATAKITPTTTGKDLDNLARQFLQKEGKDYDHGTGHGVGYFLSVHESPPSISKRADKIYFQEGMIVSNEPGYYKEGEYGIRIENLLLVEKSDEEGILQFKTLTLVPIDERLVDFDLLDDSEKRWLKDYQYRCC